MFKSADGTRATVRHEASAGALRFVAVFFLWSSLPAAGAVWLRRRTRRVAGGERAAPRLPGRRDE